MLLPFSAATPLVRNSVVPRSDTPAPFEYGFCRAQVGDLNFLKINYKIERVNPK